ncbi:MAG: ATP-binding cassette domain-containing protein [Thermodesulfovibrionia bacterium]|nr:ATP-binding cassette domain-containing protein [Thermodesulfovibrionia bacterium]
MSYIVEMNEVSMAYRGPNGSPIEVLKKFNLSVEPGTFLAILGPSGCGKTTILNLIGSLIKETSGRINVIGKSPEDALRERAFSFVFQNPVLLPWRTVRENVALAGEIFHDENIVKRAENYVLMLGLTDFLDAYPAQLSGGMQARVAIARAFSYEPKLLLLDEPFGALDSMTRTAMNTLLLNLLNQNSSITTVLVTHSIEEAIYLADRVIVLSDRPADILWNEQILMEKPRNLATRNSQDFLKYHREVEQVVFGNGLKLNSHGDFSLKYEKRRFNK